MSNFNNRYKQYVESKNKISPYDIERGRFYLIKEYVNVDGQKIQYKEAEAPIIFVLFASKRKDEIHAIKISNTNPNLIRKLFKNLVDKETKDIEFILKFVNEYFEIKDLDIEIPSDLYFYGFKNYKPKYNQFTEDVFIVDCWTTFKLKYCFI